MSGNSDANGTKTAKLENSAENHQSLAILRGVAVPRKS
jgi:hypothetical protein